MQQGEDQHLQVGSGAAKRNTNLTASSGNGSATSSASLRPTNKEYWARYFWKSEATINRLTSLTGTAWKNVGHMVNTAPEIDDGFEKVELGDK